MKLAIMSDLHLEFERDDQKRNPMHGPLVNAPPPVDADLVLLAGDVHTKGRGPRWAARAFHETPVVMLGGNHEAYGDSLYAVIAKCRAKAEAEGMLPSGDPRVTFLERETFVWTAPDGVRLRIIAATLWTDFALFGTARKFTAETAARRDMNDFRAIRILDEHGATRRFDPQDAASIHALSLDYIKAELSRPFDGVSVVATHHAPSYLSVPDAYKDDPLSAAYASSLEELILDHQPDLWVHGHTHTSFDYAIGATRILCNPRGYWPDALNPDFVWGKTVEFG